MDDDSKDFNDLSSVNEEEYWLLDNTLDGEDSNPKNEHGTLDKFTDEDIFINSKIFIESCKDDEHWLIDKLCDDSKDLKVDSNFDKENEHGPMDRFSEDEIFVDSIDFKVDFNTNNEDEHCKLDCSHDDDIISFELWERLVFNL